MASYLKQIAAFSEDAICIEIKNLDPTDQLQLTKSLLALKNSLTQKCSSKKNKNSAKKSKFSKEDYFNELIAGIEEKVNLFVERRDKGNESIDVDFNFSIHFDRMSLEEKIDTHRRLGQFHNNCEILTNVANMLLGKLYFSFRSEDRHGLTLKEFYHVKIPEATYYFIRKRQKYHCLIRNFPMLLVTYPVDIILRHGNALWKHLEGIGQPLAKILRTEMTFVSNGTQVKIKPFSLPFIQSKSKISLDGTLAMGRDESSSSDNDDDVYMPYDADIKISLKLDGMERPTSTLVDIKKSLKVYYQGPPSTTSTLDEEMAHCSMEDQKPTAQELTIEKQKKEIQYLNSKLNKKFNRRTKKK